MIGTAVESRFMFPAVYETPDQEILVHTKKVVESTVFVVIVIDDGTEVH